MFKGMFLLTRRANFACICHFSNFRGGSELGFSRRALSLVGFYFEQLTAP